ncbi:Adenosine 3'-phospho 5'-phosphosulfate transporter PAPST [Gracilaria domingensis]|nr:Adenosine 3'-phospho 5'-phosphosulfate transporter PAPST [Gracilaria domingensis]
MLGGRHEYEADLNPQYYRVSRTGLVEESTENCSGPEPLHAGHAMAEEEIGHKHRQELADGHDGGIQECAELLDSICDGKLTGYCRKGKHRHVTHDCGEANAHETRAHVDVKHLIVDGHLIARKELLLESGSKAIKGQVAEHEQKAVVGVLVGGLLGLDVSRQEEDGTTQGNEDGDAVLDSSVALSGHEGAPDHNGNHLGALGQGLGGEGNPLEGLVLTAGSNNITNTDHEVLVQRGLITQFGEVALREQDASGHKSGGETIGEDENKRILEVLAFLVGGFGAVRVGLGHDSLLQQGVQHE